MPIPEVINEGIVVVPGTGTSGKHPTSRTQSGLLSQLLNLHPNSFPPGHPYQVTSSQDVTRPGDPSALTSSSKLAAALPLAAQVTAQAQTIPENSGIHHFIWEHLNDVHQILHRLGHTGAKVRSWPPYNTISDICAFLHTAGTMRNWAKNYSAVAHPSPTSPQQCRLRLGRTTRPRHSRTQGCHHLLALPHPHRPQVISPRLPRFRLVLACCRMDPLVAM